MKDHNQVAKRKARTTVCADTHREIAVDTKGNPKTKGKTGHARTTCLFIELFSGFSITSAVRPFAACNITSHGSSDNSPACSTSATLGVTSHHVPTWQLRSTQRRTVAITSHTCNIIAYAIFVQTCILPLDLRAAFAIMRSVGPLTCLLGRLRIDSTSRNPRNVAALFPCALCARIRPARDRWHPA